MRARASVQGNLSEERGWRRRPELNRRTRFCRPLRNHSATTPMFHRALEKRKTPGRNDPGFDLKTGAGKGARTLDLNLGKVALYQLSYSRGAVVRRRYSRAGRRTVKAKIVRCGVDTGGCLEFRAPGEKSNSGGGDRNRTGTTIRRQILSLLRLPIPPHRRARRGFYPSQAPQASVSTDLRYTRCTF